MSKLLLKLHWNNTIYYKFGSFSTHDSLVSSCHISFGLSGLAKGESIIECATYTNGEIENIIDLEKVDRIEKKDGKIISGEQLMKKFRNFKIVYYYYLYIVLINIIIMRRDSDRPGEKDRPEVLPDLCVMEGCLSLYIYIERYSSMA